MNTNNLPDLYELWNYSDPAETAKVFKNILPQARSSNDTGYLIELLTQIARTESLQRNFANAHELLDEAQALLSPSLIIPQIRLWLEQGRTYNSSGKASLAVPLFEQAFHAGQEAGAVADFYTIDAAHMLGIAAHKKDDQLSWNLRALELAKQSADPRAQKWQGSLLNNIGWSYHDQGDYKQALDIFNQAYVWHKENVDYRPEQISTAKWCIGRTYRSLERYSEALALQKELEAESEEPDGFVAEEIGECLLAIGKTSEARPYFAQAHALLSQLGWIDEARLQRLNRLGLSS